MVLTMNRRYITGQQLADFVNHHWPKGWYVEDFPEDIEDSAGVLLIAPDEIVDLTNMGWVVMEKEGEEIGLRTGRSKPVDFIEFYNHLEKKRCKKSRSSSSPS